MRRIDYTPTANEWRRLAGGAANDKQDWGQRRCRGGQGQVLLRSELDGRALVLGGGRGAGGHDDPVAAQVFRPVQRLIGRS